MPYLWYDHPAGIAFFLVAAILVGFALMELPVLGLESSDLAIIAAVFAAVSSVYARGA
ncbi:MAG: hypothetical protein U5K37_08365 [Natrialbaceae archaeon]|nr:hypothetical protein [Natrialbaceae archaeon]